MQNLVSIPFNPARYEQTVFIVAVDLSKPGTAIANVQYWISAIRELSGKIHQRLLKGAPERAAKLESACNEFWS